MRWACFIVALFALSPAASAQSTEGAQDAEFTKLVNDGLDQYQASKFEEAIASFKAALAIKADPKLLYNIARSYEKLGKIDESVDTYQKFVDSPGTTAQDRAKALEQIRALKAEKAAREAAKAEPETATAKTGQGDAKQQPQSAGAGGQGAAVARTEAPARAEKSRLVPFALIGVGAAAVVVGGIFGGLALSEKSSYDSATTEADKVSHRDNGNRDAVISDIGVLGGIGIAAAGVVLLLVSGSDEGQVALAPSLTPHGLGASLAARF